MFVVILKRICVLIYLNFLLVLFFLGLFSVLMVVVVVVVIVTLLLGLVVALLLLAAVVTIVFVCSSSGPFCYYISFLPQFYYLFCQRISTPSSVCHSGMPIVSLVLFASC